MWRRTLPSWHLEYGIPCSQRRDVQSLMPELPHGRLWLSTRGGTKEFIKRNGEFTVNILGQANCPIGVVYVPARQSCSSEFAGDKAAPRGRLERGGWSVKLGSKRKPILLARPPFTVVASRSHVAGDGPLHR